MRFSSRRLLGPLSLTVFLFFSLSLRSAVDRPALVLAISIDQFRGDYLERFREHFGEGGFNLLIGQGAYFSNCHYQHSQTTTACGHAVMLTGVHANFNGIIGNEWLDRETFERISCVGDPDVAILGLPPGLLRMPGINDPYFGRSPRNLMVNTVGDDLKLARGGRPKVLGISNKDRSAILMSGKLADAAYFMSGKRMVSSTYYMKQLPAWVEAWNAAGKADAYFGRVWDRVLPESAYAVQGPDDAPGEEKSVAGVGNTFPKKITGGEKAPGGKFYDALGNSPFSNELLVDFTEAAIVNENLGMRAGITDILCVSFSANDKIGHLWGPDSHEIMDNVVRMDRTLAALFRFIDERIGLKHCTIVLTADHGVAPMPETVNRINPGIPTSRNYAKRVVDACAAALDAAFGPLADKSQWFQRDDLQIRFYASALKEKGIASAEAQRVVRDALRSLDCIEAAYTRDQLERGEVFGELGQRALLSFNRQRSGDVYFQAKPYFINKASGSTHSSPYNYDTHVPLVWYGVGVKPGVRTDRVGVADLAPTLSSILGLPAPPMAEGKVLF